jgi:hypothetical protein
MSIIPAVPNSFQGEPRSILASLYMDLEESTQASTRTFLESSENREKEMNQNIDRPLDFLPPPQIYQRGPSYAFLDTKAIEARSSYRAFFNRSIGIEARL